MPEEKPREMPASRLAEIMGVDPKKYDKFSVPRFGHTALDPRELFRGDKTIENFPEGIKSVKKGKYKSGEVWMDNFYEVIYLYIGKTPEGRDVVMDLGGDSPYAGRIEQGVINGRRDKDGRIFFDRRLFP